MKVKRYVIRDGREPAIFEPEDIKHSFDFEWFIGKDMIGISGVPNAPKTCLIKNLFIGSDSLVISEWEEAHPTIRRRNRDNGYMEPKHSGIGEVSQLIKFLKEHRVVHLYHMSSGIHNRDKTLARNMVTFSANAPNHLIYRHDSTIPIEFAPLSYQSAVRKIFSYLPFRR